MRLKITTDYAIRIILYMAQQGVQVTTAKEVAAQLGMTYNYFNKIASKIKRLGFIESVQGPKGGYRLAKDAADITLYDIVEAMEGSICINQCLEEDGYCSRNATPSCLVHRIFKSIQTKTIEMLSGTRICDLIYENVNET
ncbi:RrF2 family transcriptional regulator [Lacrimispora sphenoides]|uniref:Rrf2 family protein n=1 Tax=Lacrimispora sphenoides JCM 1415 TaxID=1297793 RepID=A0ABY1C852_9FIRM|nr:Rrf2 family transcriptional regulator [Lacrimispora sphenoides]SET78534.1 Rrf2 family protein [[Clostridium] sphenoides JCM 1415]SUY51242.1 rrf2 family protein [Lacrimispora sphenoides]